MPTESTQVAIVGAGPAGLVLSHLLEEAGIHSILLDTRTRDQIEETIRAGILEQGTVDLLKRIDPDTRVDSVGQRHDGIVLGFDGEEHRVDLSSLTGRSVWLYPQHEVLKDMLALRLRRGQDIRFGVTATEVSGVETGRPTVHAKHSTGEDVVVEADIVVGADGSRSVVRSVVAGATGNYFREYPFAWFGILCDAPPSSQELIYSNSPRGFALISQRNKNVQRMYFQCDPAVDTADLHESEIWDTLQARVPNTTLQRGPIIQRDLLRFRSFVARRLCWGRAVLVGDAAHTVPPTGAKGMNLAVADVVILADALRALFSEDDERLLDSYAETALRRIWKAQHFSWWMTSMLHEHDGASAFDRARQLGELRSVVESQAGLTYLAEGYTGWPLAGA